MTITDPTHPLYGQTLPLLTVRVNRSKTHVTVLLPTGRRRSVPRSVTDLERPAEEASPDPPLPVISVRTILPLARFVQGLGAWQRRKGMQSRASKQPNQIPPVPTTIWHQLPPSSQQQLAHLMAQLIQRVRVAKSDKGHNDER